MLMLFRHKAITCRSQAAGRKEICRGATVFPQLMVFLPAI